MTPKKPKQPKKPKEVKPKGRPSILTDQDLQARIINAIRLGLRIEDACEFAGVARSTYYNWQKMSETDPKYATFLDALKKAMVERKVRHLQNMEKHSATTWVVSAWMLERMWPEEFGRSDRLKVDAKVGVVDLTRTPEEVTDIIKKFGLLETP